MNKLPAKIVADLMNLGAVDASRFPLYKGKPYLHVSDLIKLDSRFKFCPREKCINHFDTKEKHGTGLTPGYELLFGMGNAIHDFVRNRWMDRSPYGKYVWGNWVCPCKRSKVEGFKPSGICDICKCKIDIYEEFDLISKKYRIVGHPDMLILYKGVFYIYEIKAIERSDMTLDQLKYPLGDHTIQGEFYYWLLRHMRKERISPVIRYLYVDRGYTKKLYRGNCYKEFRKKIAGKERIKKFLDKAEVVVKAVDSHRLPERICKTVKVPRAKSCKCAVPCFERKSSYV